MDYNAPFNGEKFNNLEPFEDKTIGELLRWRLFSQREKWPTKVENEVFSKPSQRYSGSGIRYRLINHATVLIQWQGLNILTDPIYSERSSPVSWLGPKRVRQPALRFEDLPSIDIVLISHNHYDHLDIPTLKKLNSRFKPQFFVGLRNKELLASEGIENVVEMDWWQDFKIGEISLSFVPVRHWSARSLFDRFETLWGGFILKGRGKTIFFAGDTGYGEFFKLIKEKYGAPNLSFLPIGAYEPRWFMKNAHMNPLESVKAHHDLESKNSVGIHFETFQLTNEAYETPRRDFLKAWEESERKGLFIAPVFGKEYELM